MPQPPGEFETWLLDSARAVQNPCGVPPRPRGAWAFMVIRLLYEAADRTCVVINTTVGLRRAAADILAAFPSQCLELR